MVRPGGDPAVASCALQRENCLHFVRARSRHGWHALDEHFDDEGHSGATVERPALERLFARIRAGEVDRVVVYRLDRLTRRVVDWALLARLLEHYRVGLTVVAGSIDIDGGAIARMQLNTLAIFSELERELIGARLADNRAARKARGLRSAGRIPLGYGTDRQTKQLTVLEPEAATVRWLFAAAASGKTTTELVAAANASKRQTKSGGAWSQRTLLRLLQNPVYAGRHPDGSPAQHPAIVDAELFARVQSLIVERRTRKPTKRTPVDDKVDPFILRGLLECEACGHVMSPSMSERLTAKSAKKAPRYYRCRTVGCPTGQVTAATVEDEVLAVLRAPDPRWTAAVRARLSELAAAWELMWLVNRRRALAEYFERIAWRARAAKVVLEPAPIEPAPDEVPQVPGPP